jgi:glycerol-3-phosphate dehydrogenase (NAD(P)+)
MVLSGPNIADEIMRKNISASVIAGDDKKTLGHVSDLFNTDFFKIFLSNDTKGVEMAGALKNLYAICSGLSDGLGFESNTKAMLLTRSLSEMSDLFRKINANPLTLLGLSGVGDLIATSSSEKSRNYSFGKLLGKGNSSKKALGMINQSVEGHRTLKVIYFEKKKLSLNMPIIEALYKIVYLKKDPRQCFLKFIHESGNIDTVYD